MILQAAGFKECRVLVFQAKVAIPKSQNMDSLLAGLLIQLKRFVLGRHEVGYTRPQWIDAIGLLEISVFWRKQTVYGPATVDLENIDLTVL